MLRKIIFAAIASIIFLPGVALAQENKIPALNPICWKGPACQEQRKLLNPEADPKDGWIKDQIDCPGEEWGKCLPAGVATTQIAFGGQKRFLHIGDFIQSLYKYAIGVAGIVAVTMIIIAGFQWVSSGGNSEVITSAKKRIAGALTGLFIAYAAYFILNTINPALVNLRLPQVYMIRPQNLVPKFCSTIPDNIKNSPNAFALAADTDNQKNPVKLSDKTEFKFTFKNQSESDKNEKNFYCGKRFFIKDGGETTCFGNYCDPGNVCVNFGSGDTSNPNKYYCADGMLAGRIAGTVGGSSGIQIDNNLGLFVLCKDGKVEEIGKELDVPTDKKPQQYKFPLPNTSVADHCSGEKNIVGYYFGAEGNDETGGSGKLGEGGLFAAGTDDWYAVGREPGSNICDVNLSRIAFSLTSSEIQNAWAKIKLNDACSFFAHGSKLWGEALANKPEVISRLITLDELKKGFTCDIIMDRDSFPAINNTQVVLDISKNKIGFLAGIIDEITKAGTFGAWLKDPTSCAEAK